MRHSLSTISEFLVIFLVQNFLKKLVTRKITPVVCTILRLLTINYVTLLACITANVHGASSGRIAAASVSVKDCIPAMHCG